MPALARSAAAAAALLLLCGRAAAHAILNKPLSRNGLACAENTKEAHPCTAQERASQGGMPFGMARGGKVDFQGEGWFTLNTHYVGNATLLSKEDHDLLTYCTKGGVPPDYKDCDWSLAADGHRPWRAPGTAPVNSPCGAVGGDSGAFLGTALPPVPTANRSTWTVGGTESVAFGLAINHGGGYSYRLCPASEQLTEACFQRMPLRFVGDTQDLVGVNGSLLHTIPARRTADSHWTRNPIPISERFFPAPAPGAVGCGYACPSEVPQDDNKIYNFNIVDKVEVPAGFPPGDYVLGFRWDCEQMPEVWSNCADITIAAAGPTPPAPAPPAPKPSTCPGGSLDACISVCPTSPVAVYVACCKNCGDKCPTR